LSNSPLHDAERQAARQVALDQHAEDDRGDERGDSERARLAVLRGLEAKERAEDGRQRGSVKSEPLQLELRVRLR
jgi:hypothetical protein